MEADWEFEVGGDAPVIEAIWSGFVDLRRDPERAADLAEAVMLPGLAAALKSLNAASSPVWTSKCDVYPNLAAAEFDADELDAGEQESACAAACFIDLLPAIESAWLTPELASSTCMRICRELSPVELRRCRLDLVIRRASIVPERMELGVTSYLTACGRTAEEAKAMLAQALESFVRAVNLHSTLQ